MWMGKKKILHAGQVNLVASRRQKQLRSAYIHERPKIAPAFQPAMFAGLRNRNGIKSLSSNLPQSQPHQRATLVAHTTPTEQRESSSSDAKVQTESQSHETTAEGVDSVELQAARDW
jgi:hypothetical protein